jgi:hypothetical protein
LRPTLKAAPERCPASDWRLLHDNESASVQMVDKPLGHDPRHELDRVVLPLAAIEAQRDGERVGEVCGLGRREAFGRTGHCVMIADRSAPPRRRLVDDGSAPLRIMSLRRHEMVQL